MHIQKVALAVGTALVFAVVTQVSAQESTTTTKSTTTAPACSSYMSKHDCKKNDCTWTSRDGFGRSKVAGSCK